VYWIYDIPSWQLGLLIILSFLIVGITGLLVSRKWVYKKFRISDDSNEAISAIFAGVGMLYGLLLGLVAVASWQNFDNVGGLASKEAASVVALYRDVSVLQEPAKQKLQQDLERYLIHVINIDWPAHQRGEIANGGAFLLSMFHGDLAAYQPNSSTQQVLLAEALSAFNKLAEMRRARMDAVSTGIPAVFWVVILVGALLTIPSIYFFHLPSMATHLAVTGMFSIFLGCMIFLVAAVDNPFRGEVSVSPEPYQAVLDNLKNLDPSRIPQ
jgi:hypothetical protein